MSIVLLNITVPGVPQPKGSMRSFVPKDRRGQLVRDPRNGRLKISMTNNSPLTREWQHRVSYFAKSALPGAVPAEGAYRVTGAFKFQRPTSHLLRGVDSLTGLPRMRKDAPPRHTYKPDLDKLIRAVLDALTGIVYPDDSQVMELDFSKSWSLTDSGVWLKVEVLT